LYRRLTGVLCVLVTLVIAAGADDSSGTPYEAGRAFSAANRIDDLVLAELRKKSIEPAGLCPDAVFLRRAYLDVIGTLPEPRRVQRFLDDDRSDKRLLLVDELMKRDEFADYWTLKWCDLLRVKAEFPINMWPNGVQAYARWIRDAVGDNMPYDRFARHLLTSSGSNFRVPAVNFYRGIQGEEPSSMAAAVALTFMGVRIEKWPEERRTEMEKFFSRVAFKGTAEWKEVIVLHDPAPAEPMQAVFPDGRRVTIKADDDPREVFADWLIDADNEWFARSIVNRVWSWFMGRGLVHEPDDIRPDNPAVHPRVLDFLAAELVRSGYDLRHVYRLILGSNVYQQSSVPRSDHPDATALFAHYPVRRLDAEVLLDALCWISGSRERYSSAIPEPFTFVPERNRTIELNDGSITSQQLKMFGRPARDTGLESERSNQSNTEQRLHMLNSTHVRNKIEKSWRLRNLMKETRGKPAALSNRIYMTVLSRLPTDDERAAAAAYFEKNRNSRQAATDLAWALLNSKEFLYRH